MFRMGYEEELKRGYHDDISKAIVMDNNTFLQMSLQVFKKNNSGVSTTHSSSLPDFALYFAPKTGNHI